jgi:bifunctional UDP-N-acetylglucosamine pyrophosphorylase/glucosamine-1-phosphate N-acetyltransferase
MKAVILAAGSSSRFRPLSDKRHKGLTTLLGKTIIEHTVSELRSSGVDEIIVVQGPDRQIEKEMDQDIEYVVQDEPRGMGDALSSARHLLDGKFMVLTPYRANASKFFEPMMEKSESENSDTVFVAAETDRPEDYGVLELNSDGKAVDLVEKPSPSEAPSNLRIVGMYLLEEKFFDYLEDVETWEYAFEEALSNQLGDSPASVLKIKEETNSVKYPWDLFEVTKELKQKSERRISEEAEIAESAEIQGKVVVEDGAEIYENAVIKGPAYIGEDTVVGNNSVIRDHVVLEKGSTVGANAEVKNSIFQPESSMHSGFVGDSIIGRNSRLGAGTVVANRLFRSDGGRPEIEVDLLAKDFVKQTGRDYLGAFIGENVDIGVNVSIMPGVGITSDTRVAPGTVVDENIEEEVDFYRD